MFGRRFYDPNEDGDTSDGLLQPGSGLGPHLALLRDIEPLLGAADVTVVNMETPLVDQPYIDPTRPRPPRFHPTKTFVFASAPVSGRALREAGVDVVDVGNNHLYDALEPGVSSTIKSLEDAGFQAGSGHFGGGLNEADAWRPAVVRVKGQTIAFIGCTTETLPFERLGPTIAGIPNVRRAPGASYVAEDDVKGGAAECNKQKIIEAVQEARRSYDVVVFMLHGGIEYWPSPPPVVQELSKAAAGAGAALVIDGHPHVVGGVSLSGPSLIAWSMGNLLFDQAVWPSFQSYLLDVDVRDGRVVQAYTEPLMMENYRPEGVTGGLADYVARTAAGREQIPATIEDGAAEFDVARQAVPNTTARTIDGGSPRGTIFQMPAGAWASSFSGSGRVELGRDLLWVGSFEDEDVDSDLGEAVLWDTEAGGVEFSAAGAFQGKGGARLVRQAAECHDAVLDPLHRLLVEPGKGISVVGMARPSAGGRLALQLSWYRDLKGPSFVQTVRSIEPSPNAGWRPFRLDATVPPRTVAVGLFVRLSPPLNGVATADLDDLRVIEWDPDHTAMSPLYGFIRVKGTGRVQISHPYLPGAKAWAATQRLEPLAQSPSDYLTAPAVTSATRASCQEGE